MAGDTGLGVPQVVQESAPSGLFRGALGALGELYELVATGVKGIQDLRIRLSAIQEPSGARLGVAR